MKTNLAYIDEAMDRAVEAEHATPTVPKVARDDAAKQARKLIGGFRVHDGVAERKALDDMIAKRLAALDKFRTDRTAIRDALGKLGVTPLAVCPTGAWWKICKDAGLFVLSPDKEGRVGIASNWHEGVKKPDSLKPAELLAKFFPDGISMDSTHKATLILPDPPADVADILCKVQGLKLTVAAVGEAIRFGEKPSELVKANAHPKDQWAQAQGYEDYQDWLKRDPIIFTEHGDATAIVAQFGDFPIEKTVVDAVVASDSLISTKPTMISTKPTMISGIDYGLALRAGSVFTVGVDDDYRQEIVRMMRMQRDMQRAAIQSPRFINSRDWTG